MGCRVTGSNAWSFPVNVLFLSAYPRDSRWFRLEDREKECEGRARGVARTEEIMKTCSSHRKRNCSVTARAHIYEGKPLAKVKDGNFYTKSGK